MSSHENVSNIFFNKDAVSLSAIILKNVHAGRMVDLQVASDIPPSQLADYANWGFRKWGLRGKLLESKDIEVDNSEIKDKDVHFVEEFGYVIQKLAVAKLSDRGVEAWIGPTLIHKNHPLARADQKSASFGVSQDPPASKGFGITPPSDIVSAHYLRITVDDRSMVLARVCSELAQQDINICELRQPGNYREEVDPRTGLVRKIPMNGEPTDIAFLLDPCERRQVDMAISRIRDLDVVFSIDALFRVLGNPTQDISNSHPQ